MRHVRRLAIAAPFLIAACSDASPTGIASRQPAPSRPSAAISDAVHNGGTAGFYFLAPLVAQPKFSGTFDPHRQVSVYVCSLGGSVRAAPEPSCTGGERVSPVEVNVNGQHYHANWNMDLAEFPAGSYYRIRVVDNATGGEYAYADVYLAGTGREFRSIDQSSFVPLLDGRTLPIKFRMEEGVTPGGSGGADGPPPVECLPPSCTPT
jgi:hypothetical protein